VDDPNFVLLIDDVETGIGDELVGSYSWIRKVVGLEYCTFDSSGFYLREELVSRNIQLCSTLIDSPGARVLYSPNFAAISGEYLMDKPVNKGRPPFA